MGPNASSTDHSGRASARSRKQRSGGTFVGAFGRKTGDSDLLFVQGQLPEDGDRIASDESPERQVRRCLQNLEAEVKRHGKGLENVVQLTLYLAEMDAYEAVNDAYEQYFGEVYPARTTVGVCDLLGGALVTVDAVVAIE